MLLEKFAPRSNARTGYEHLVGQMDGAPKDGLFAAKIGFHTEMLLDAPPTLLVNIKKCSHEVSSLLLEADLRPLLLRFGSLPSNICRISLLSAKNRGTEIHASAIAALQSTSAFLNTDEDNVYFVHEGDGVCDTVLGGMKYRAGDFIFIPRHFHHRFRAEKKTSMVGIGSSSALRKPARKDGENMDVPYSNFSISLPDPNLRHKEGGGPWLLAVKRGGEYYRALYSCPTHCVAYKSTLYPFIVNVSQLNFSYTTSIHADPTNFCLFGTADDSVMISVLGARFVHSPPYNHLNEWDEFLFYSKAYSARAGTIVPGDATLHPQGIWHGPQIPALMNWQKPEHPVWVDDLAIMFESKEPLFLCESAKNIFVPDYEKSWLRGWEECKKE